MVSRIWGLFTGISLRRFLYEEAIRRREGQMAHLGPLVVRTGEHTGRAPNEKFVVKEPSSEGRVWWGEVNRPFDPQDFDRIHHRLLAYLQGKEIYVQDCYRWERTPTTGSTSASSRNGLAQPVRPQYVHPGPGSQGPC